MECTTPRVNPNVNYGLWVTVMCQYRFISYNKYTSLGQGVDSGKLCMCWVGSIRELYILLSFTVYLKLL